MPRLCKHGCGRPAAPRRRECEACRHKTPAKANAPSRRRGRWSNVGGLLSPADWRRLYAEQGGVCACCGHALRDRYAPTHRPDERIASVDHDHVVEHALRKMGVERDEAVRRSVRGLLCGYPCNRLLVRHWTQERLASTLTYLQHWPSLRAGVVAVLPAVRQ